jgi:hypothetical protein
VFSPSGQISLFQSLSLISCRQSALHWVRGWFNFNCGSRNTKLSPCSHVYAQPISDLLRCLRLPNSLTLSVTALQWMECQQELPSSLSESSLKVKHCPYLLAHLTSSLFVSVSLSLSPSDVVLRRTQSCSSCWHERVSSTRRD